MTRKKLNNDTAIETLKHKDKRVNIPTKELRDFVAEYEARPKTILYPRDPSLDPQLVWKGKDEQDAQDLAVPAVPVYIQEKIHPIKNGYKIPEGSRRFRLVSLWPASFNPNAVFSVPEVIERCLLMTTDPGDLVLDPTCGSGTTACVAEQWGRRWITIDTSRVALALARTRLMAAKYPFYLLADSQEGINKEAELTAKMPPSYKTEGDIKKGFVYKRVPHVTLKSIANNEEIDSIHGKYQEKLEPLRNQLNKQLKKSWEEWQIPREAEEKWAQKAKELHKEWWRLRQERQKEIDASIARHADTEILFDQPYEDNKRIRVTGPFTMESLSPHRVLDPTFGVGAGG